MTQNEIESQEKPEKAQLEKELQEILSQAADVAAVSKVVCSRSKPRCNSEVVENALQEVMNRTKWLFEQAESAAASLNKFLWQTESLHSFASLRAAYACFCSTVFDLAKVLIENECWEESRRISKLLNYRNCPFHKEVRDIICDAYYEEAKFELKERQWLKVWQLYDESLEFNPNFRDFMDLLRKSILLSTAEALDAQKWEEARTKLKDWLTSHPGNEEVKQLLKQTCLEPAKQALGAGRWEEARAHLREGVRALPNDSDLEALSRKSYVKLVKRAFQNERWEEARGYLREWLESYPDDQDARQLFKESYMRPAEQALGAGRWEEARVHLRDGLQALPDDSELRALLGTSYVEQAKQAQENEKWTEAGDLLRTWLKIDPTEARSLLGRSSRELVLESIRKNDWEKALCDAERWQDECPEDITGEREGIFNSYPYLSWWLLPIGILHEIPGEDEVYSLAFSPDNKFLAMGCDSGYVKLVNLVNGQWYCKKMHKGPVKSIGFLRSRNIQLLVSGSSDGAIRVWKVSQGGLSLICSLEIPPAGAVSSMTLAPDRMLLASVGRDNKISIWNIKDEKLWRYIDLDEPPVSTIFSSNGLWLASGGAEGVVRIWDIGSSESGKRVHFPAGCPLVGHKGTVRSLAFSTDGDLLASGGEDGIVRMWQLGKGLRFSGETPIWPKELLAEGFQDPILSVAIQSKIPYLLATAHQSGDLIVSCWRKNEKLRLNESQCPVLSVSFSPDGLFLASTGTDRTVRLWGPMSGR